MLSDSTKRAQYDKIYKSNQKETPSFNQSNRQSNNSNKNTTNKQNTKQGKKTYFQQDYNYNHSSYQHPNQDFSDYEEKLRNLLIKLICGLGIICIITNLSLIRTLLQTVWVLCLVFRCLANAILESIVFLLINVKCVILHILPPLMYTLGRMLAVLVPLLIKSLLFGIQSLVNVLYFAMDNIS